MEQTQPPGDSGLFPVKRHLVGLWDCYVDTSIRWKKTMQEGKCWHRD